jgi:diadenosine tetraphosphatase ApaH/serine/threonine PP2A family protein phosphatase
MSPLQVVDGRILCVHGGLSPGKRQTLIEKDLNWSFYLLLLLNIVNMYGG